MRRRMRALVADTSADDDDDCDYAEIDLAEFDFADDMDADIPNDAAVVPQGYRLPLCAAPTAPSPPPTPPRHTSVRGWVRIGAVG